MASRKKQRGFIEWLPAVASVAGAVLGKEGGENTNDANADINNAQMAFNASESAKAREFNQYEADQNRRWQEAMASTSYQRVVGDLKGAGINPMLAYMKGGAATPNGGAASGPAANSGGMIPMQNTSQAGVNGAVAAAQIANVQSQTKVNEAQAEKVRAETPQVIASTGQIQQQTKNLEEGLKKTTAEIDNVKMDTLSKEEQVTLTRAQQQLVNVQKELARSNITFTEAQTKMQGVLTTLRQLDVPAATNEARFETAMGEKVGVSGNTSAKILQLIQSLLGKR